MVDRRQQTLLEHDLDHVSGGHHNIVAGGPGLQLGQHGLVVFVGVVVDFDTELLFEIRNRVFGNVIRPIVDV